MTVEKGLSEEQLIDLRNQLMSERSTLQDQITLITNRLKCRRCYHRHKNRKKDLKKSVL